LGAAVSDERGMNSEKLTSDIAATASTVFASLMSQHASEYFYAFALYTDEDGYTVMPSANSVERYEAIVARKRAVDPRHRAAYKWSTAEWAYEAWGAEAFTGIYRSLEQHRATMPTTDGARSAYKKSLHACMTDALARVGRLAGRGEEVVLFISSSSDDEAFELENWSAKELNSEAVYRSFLGRYGDART
jgi:hypothetical protein